MYTSGNRLFTRLFPAYRKFRGRSCAILGWCTTISRAIFFALAIALVLTACDEPEPTPRPIETLEREAVAPGASFTFPETIAVISKQRYEAEALVLRVKRDGNITDEQYDTAVQLYEDARVKFNLWIDEVRAGLTTSDFNLEAENSEWLREAMEAKELFETYVDNGYDFGRGQASVGAAAALLIQPVVAAAIDLWESAREADAEQMERMSDLLKEQMWVSFDQVQ